jgi:undecaprenyl-diphosphatase
LLLEHYAETVLRSPFVIAFMMIAVALLLWWVERRSGLRKNLGQLTLADSLAIGAAQALAVVPGTSRSGITMAAALFRGVQRPAAARFSFLLSTPIIGAAAAKAGWDILAHGPLTPDQALTLGLGIAVSAVSGLIAISWLVRYLQQRTFRIFIWYRLVCGIIILALAFFSATPS